MEQREGEEGPCGLLAGVSPAAGPTKGALCVAGCLVGQLGPGLPGPGLCWAGHLATGNPLRTLSSESQLPLGWLAQSPAAWRGEGLAALSQEEQRVGGVGGGQREAVLALGVGPKGNKI